MLPVLALFGNDVAYPMALTTSMTTSIHEDQLGFK